MADAIDITGLTVDRGGNRVLESLSLTVASGSVTGLLGPSGSGKSTLMRAIVGVQQIVSGTVTVLGATAGDASLRRRVGYMTQAPSVYLDLSPVENLRFFATMHGVGRDDIERVLDAVDLPAGISRPTAELSGGQRSRVSLATALLGDPDLLVLDEPTVGLDPVLRRSLWELFHALSDDGMTLLVSSHVMDEADRCDRLLLMDEGDIIADDTPDAVRATGPDDDLESAFIDLVAGRRDGER